MTQNRAQGNTRTFFKTGGQVSAFFTRTTGTIIRFRTAQVSLLPISGTRCTVQLPDGQRVEAKLNTNRMNPNLTGPGLRRWIQQWIYEDGSVEIWIEETEPFLLCVRLASTSNARQSTPSQVRAAIEQLMANVSLDWQSLDRRRTTYEAWERDPAWRKVAIAAWGPGCQVVNCPFLTKSPDEMEAVVELHHLNHIGKGGSDIPLNWSLVCANHHRMIHHLDTTLVRWNTEEAVVRLPNEDLCIRRNVRVIWK